MNKFFFVLPLFLTSCLRTHQEILDEGGQLTYKESGEVQTQQPMIDGSVSFVNERLDVLERDSVNKQDMDASIENLKQTIDRLEIQVSHLEARLNQQQKSKATLKKQSKIITPFEKAEKHFQGKKWKLAIFAYEKFRKDQPQSSQFQTATLKIGLSFIQLGLQKEAKVFFEEVVERFPKSKEAKEAQKLLKKIS